MVERDIVLAALAIDDEAARRAYVDTACAGDTNLAARVNSLIERATEDKANIGLSDAMQSKKADDAGVAATQVIIALDARAQSDSKAIEFAESAEDETLFERYQIERVLGRGGMGVVYLAKDLRLERMVALKIPRFDKEQKQLIERFHREARTMASVLHRNLCPIFDVDQDNGLHFLTMAFIEGQTLEEFIRIGSEFSSQQVAGLIRKTSQDTDQSPLPLPDKSQLKSLAAKQQELSPRLDDLIVQLDSSGVVVPDPDRLKEATAQAVERSQIALRASQEGHAGQVRTSQANLQLALEDVLGQLKSHDWAAKIGLLTIATLLLWTVIVPTRLKLVPAPLVAVIVATAVTAMLKLPVLYVEVPDNLWSEIHFPSLTVLQSVPLGIVLQAGIVLAVVVLMNWAKQHEGTGGTLVVDWESLHANFHSEPQQNHHPDRQTIA